jgi:hypothetical protein
MREALRITQDDLATPSSALRCCSLTSRELPAASRGGDLVSVDVSIARQSRFSGLCAPPLIGSLEVFFVNWFDCLTL